MPAKLERRREVVSTGVTLIHLPGCTSARCRCGDGSRRGAYQAEVYDSRTKRRVRKGFPSRKAAELWRGETRSAVRQRALGTPTKVTVAQALDALIAGMRDGTVRTSTGKEYKPGTIRAYETAATKHLIPSLGKLKLTDLDRPRVRQLIRQWQRDGVSASSIGNNLNPLQVVYREALEDGLVNANPLAGLTLPSGERKRDRVADRAEAELLLAALPEPERTLWATAMWAGLRRGELRALRVEDLDFDSELIRVRRGWDDEEGEIEPKSYAGKREVPLPPTLKTALKEHLLRTGRRSDGEALVFGSTRVDPFSTSTVDRRAKLAWGWKQVRTPGTKPGDRSRIWVKDREDALTPIALHSARHTYASYLIAAGVNVKQLSVYMGHASVTITLDRYGHLFPGDHATSAAKLDSYLADGAEVV